ncbi:hypothetical protein BJP25_11820 [Actinokineospora bangkokensis]|uniref:MFS transporter n=1 Tax=Actinokineospora bangkokensis TaxID=1193682 RepID=A0A1Q9LQW2_9PSEU|nr:hypothetical protein BJP25_11820 [Actinokineospora bangkokensis]
MITTKPRTSAVRYRDVVAEPRFRAVFGARSLATAADTLRTVALSIAIFAATDSMLLSAVTYGVSFVPQLLGGSLLGSVTDRARPRRLIAVGYGVECLLALLLATGWTPPWLSLVLVAAIAFATPVFIGLTGRVIADVLPAESYVVGRSLSLLTSSLAQLLGVVGGGGAVALLGAEGALLVAAGLHATACLWVRFGLPDLPAAQPSRPQRPGTVRATWSANRLLLGNRGIRTLILAQWLPTAAATGAEGLVIPYAATRWSAGTASLLLACIPMGMLVGTVLVGRIASPSQRPRLVVPLLLLVGLPLVTFWLPLPFPVLAVMATLTGIGLAYSLCVQARFRDLVPVPNRGQAFSLLATGLMTAQGISPAIFGLLGDHIGANVAIAVTGLVATAYAAWQGPRLVRVLRGAASEEERKA